MIPFEVNQNVSARDRGQHSIFPRRQLFYLDTNYQTVPNQPSPSPQIYMSGQSCQPISKHHLTESQSARMNSAQLSHRTCKIQPQSRLQHIPAQPNTSQKQPILNQWREAIKSQNTNRHVQKFIAKLKTSVTKSKVPTVVQQTLNSPLQNHHDTSVEGWYPWRWDVLLVDAIMMAFHIAAIFLYTTHLVLYKVKDSVFPLMYIGALMLQCFYKLNTKILIQDKAIITKTPIRLHYLLWYFPVDLLLVILSFLEFFQVNSSVFRLVAFLKIIDIRHIFHKFEAIISLYRNGLIVWRLLHIFLINIFVAHIISLILISMVNDAKQPNWMTNAGLSRHQDDWSTVYIWAFYWSTTIMLTIGFGDLTPKNTKEVAIVTFTEMFSVLIFAYCLNAIQYLLVSLRQFDTAKYHDLIIANRYMSINKVPYNLQADVKYAVANMTGTNKISEIEEQNKILAGIAPNLKQKLLLHVNMLPLMNMPFWNRFMGDSIKAIAVALQRKMYYSSEVVVVQGSVPEKLYMLKQGCLVTSILNYKDDEIKVDELFQYKKKTPIKKYLWIVLQEAVRQMPSSTTIKSSGLSMIINIPVQKALEILRCKDVDYESYCLFRDKLIIKHSEIRQKECQLCPKTDHNTLQCPYYHYIPKREIVVCKYVRQETMNKQSRSKRKRKTLQKSSYLQSYQKFQQTKQIYWCSSHKIEHSVKNLDNKINILNSSDQLTTIPNVDMIKEWKVYYRKFNLSEIIS